MIEKPHGMLAIGDVAGYVNRPDSGAATPGIGIPISEVLARYGKPVAVQGADRDIVHGEPMEEDISTTARYLKEVELEFKGEAETLLKSIDLSYLRTRASDKAQ